MAQAVGGTILFIGIVIMVYIAIYLAFFAPKGEQGYPLAEEEPDAEPTPAWIERWALWISITIALILFAYTVPIVDIVQNATPGSVPFSWPIGN